MRSLCYNSTNTLGRWQSTSDHCGPDLSESTREEKTRAAGDGAHAWCCRWWWGVWGGCYGGGERVTLADGAALIERGRLSLGAESAAGFPQALNYIERPLICQHLAAS